MENDPDFSGIKDFTQLVVIRNEKNLSYTSFNDRRVLKQALDYSTPQVWKKYNEREDGSFWLSSIEVVGFAENMQPKIFFGTTRIFIINKYFFNNFFFAWSKSRENLCGFLKSESK